VPQPVAMLREPNVDMMLIFYSKINGGVRTLLRISWAKPGALAPVWGAWARGRRTVDGGWADSGME